MSKQKKRPGSLWMFFYGRQRRGVPWLAIGVIAVVLALALTFHIPGVADAVRALGPVLLGLLLTVALVGGVVASLRPRRRR